MPRRGRHPHNELTDRVVRQAPPGKHADGNGLYLWVRCTRTRQWVQRIVVQRKRHDIGLGGYPLVPLAEARRIAFENRQLARAGGDPRTENPRKKGPTVREFYPVVTENRRTNWKTAATETSWKRGFQNYIFPIIGKTLVAAVTTEDIRRIVIPHWQGRNSRGHLLRQNLDYFFDCAIVEHHRLDKPAAHPQARPAEGQGCCHSPAQPVVSRGSRGVGRVAGAAGEPGHQAGGDLHRPYRCPSWRSDRCDVGGNRSSGPAVAGSRGPDEGESPTYGSSLPSGARGPRAGSRVKPSVFVDLPSRRSRAAVRHFRVMDGLTDRPLLDAPAHHVPPSFRLRPAGRHNRSAGFAAVASIRYCESA